MGGDFIEHCCSLKSEYLNFSFNILDGIAGLDLEGDGLPSQGLNKDLHFLCLFILLNNNILLFCVYFE